MRIHVTSFVRKGIVEQRVCVLPDSLCATCSFDTCMSVAILLKRFVSKTGSEVLRVEVQNRLTIERASSAGVAAASLQKPLSQENTPPVPMTPQPAPMTPQPGPMTPQPGPMTPQPGPMTPPAEQPSANSQQGADEQNDMDWIPEPEAVMEPQLHPLWHRVYQNTHKIPEQFKRELLVEQRRTAIQHVAMYIVTDRQHLLLQNAYGWWQSLGGGNWAGPLCYKAHLCRREAFWEGNISCNSPSIMRISPPFVVTSTYYGKTTSCWVQFMLARDDAFVEQDDGTLTFDGKPVWRWNGLLQSQFLSWHSQPRTVALELGERAT